MKGLMVREEVEESGSGSDGRSSASVVDSSPLVALGDEELEVMFDELSKARQKATVGESGGADFYVTVCGGRWTMEHLGRSHDAYRGQVASKVSDAAIFAVEYGFQVASRYNTDMYSEEGAQILAQTWVDKAQWFWDIYKEQGDPYYEFTDDDMASWEPGTAFSRLLPTWSGRALTRAVQLRDARPMRRM